MTEIEQLIARNGMKGVKAQTPWEYRVDKIKAACDKNSDPVVPNLDYAHGQCLESEELHETVWIWAPDKSAVRSKVIPALQDALRLMKLANVEEHQEELLARYISNVQARIDNLLKRYLEDLPSAFRIDSRCPADNQHSEGSQDNSHHSTDQDNREDNSAWK